MPANLSLIFNLILLVAVVIAISRLMKTRRQKLAPNSYQPSLGGFDSKPVDEIIAVRKLTPGPEDVAPQEFFYDELMEAPGATVDEACNYEPPSREVSGSYFEEEERQQPRPTKNQSKPNDQSVNDKTIMLFLLAKDNRQFAGYELLQTVLAAGLRFGEGYLFHRHQLPNGQGPVIFSLASATSSGIFDLQNIGALSVRGLCLFMQISGNPTIDTDRFNILYETARQLSEGLDAHLLDEEQRPLTKEGLLHYQRVLSGEALCE